MCFLCGCEIAEDGVLYDIEAVTGTLINKREHTYTTTTMAGKTPVTTTHHDKYVTVKTEDNAETEFESSSLYDIYDNKNEDISTITVYKVSKIKDGNVVSLSYQLTNEAPTVISKTTMIILLIGFFWVCVGIVAWLLL